MADGRIPPRDRPPLRLTLASALVFGVLGWCAASALVGLLESLALPTALTTAASLGVTLVLAYVGVRVASFYARVTGPLALRVGDAATIGGLGLIVLVMAVSLLGPAEPVGRSVVGVLLELSMVCFGIGIACVAGFFATRISDLQPATRATLLVVAAFGAGIAAAGIGVLAGVMA